MLFPNINDEEDETIKENNKTLEFPFKTKESNKKQSNKQNTSKEDSIIFVENVDIEMLVANEENKMKEELEISLEHLYDGFLEKYNKKEFFELITEIEAKEELLFINSLESFKIYILKIKSIIRLMLIDYYKSLNKDNNINENIVKQYSFRIINEFKKINILVNKNSKYENEIITQVYCKFLIFLILYEERKENRLKSLGYAILGVNMMKIYFVKDKMAKEIKTYFNYIKLILIVINHLISDDNYKRALYYIDFGFKILDIIFKFIFLWKLPKKYYIKAIDYSSFNYIYCGICLEHDSNNLNLSMENFRQASYFLEKCNLISNYSPFSSIFKNRTNRLKYENIFYLVSNSTVKLIRNELKKNKMRQELMKLKTKEQKEKEEKLNQNINDKKEKLRLIANGLSTNFKKFIPIQEKIYNKILTPKITNNIEKFDKELVDFVYSKKQNKSNISNEIKQNLCKFEIYNDLVSDKFREFIIKNEQLKFNDPSKIRDNLKRIRAFININFKDIKKDNKDENLSFTSKEKNRESRNLNLNISKENKLYSKENITTEYSKSPKKDKRYNTINIYRSKPLIKNLKKNNTSFNKIININQNRKNLRKENNSKSKSLNVFRNKTHLRIINCKTYNENKPKIKLTKKINSYKSRNNYRKLNINKSKNFHTYDLKLDNDFEKKYLDKYLTTKKYQDSYFLYEKLMKKELNFQKLFLNIKNYNSKLYFDDYKKQITSLEENINEGNYKSKEKAYKHFIIINDKVNDEVFGNKAEIQKKLNEHKKKITNIAKGFKLLGKSVFDDEKMKNCMNKVIQKYIIENRKKKLGKISNCVDNKEIKKKNEKHILKINNSIKYISSLLYKNQLKIKNSN